MILGVAHVALSTTNIVASTNELQSQGYTCLFSERNVPNSPFKTAMLTTYRATHHLAVLKAPGRSVAIEVTQHSSAYGVGRGPFQIKGSELALAAHDSVRESHFLKNAMRFQEAEGGLLSLPSPVPACCCQLRISDEPHVSKSFLDSLGMTCLAFLTNDILRDLATVATEGGTEITPAFPVLLPGRRLEAALFRSPTGVLYEFVQLISR